MFVPHFSGGVGAEIDPRGLARSLPLCIDALISSFPPNISAVQPLIKASEPRDTGHFHGYYAPLCRDQRGAGFTRETLPLLFFGNTSRTLVPGVTLGLSDLAPPRSSSFLPSDSFSVSELLRVCLADIKLASPRVFWFVLSCLWFI